MPDCRPEAERSVADRDDRRAQPADWGAFGSVRIGRGVPELLPLVRAGVRFVDGVQEKPKTTVGEVKENAA